MKLTAKSKEENDQNCDSFSPDTNVEGAYLVFWVNLPADAVDEKDADWGAQSRGAKEQTAAERHRGDGLVEKGHVEGKYAATGDIDENVADCHQRLLWRFLRVDVILVWHHLDKKNRAANHDEVSKENCLPDFNEVS